MTVADPAVTRVLVIDDSVRVRRVVTRALEHEPGVEVVAAMRNGPAAIVRSERLLPDVVLLDSEVAVDGGCATLRELRRVDPELRVVLRGDLEGLDEADVRARVLPMIGERSPAAGPGPGLSRRGGAGADAAAGAVAAGTRGSGRVRRPGPVTAVVIAASTGGPDALETVLARLPGDLPAAVLVVQHMPPGFTRMLAERLDRRVALTVAEATAGAPVLPGQVLIAPGDHHLALEPDREGVRAVLHQGPRENSCRPAADVLFRSAAEAYGAGLLAVVLTGMGHDGLAGAAAVRAAGGQVIVQSTDTAVIASMPAAVARHGLADGVVDLADLGADVAARTRAGRRR
jgi:two-component system, chemotaxis family, protein-glutamate methylesterase/glutaminase